MSRLSSTTSVDIDLSDIHEGDLLNYVQQNYSPENVFPENELEEWATENGFTRAEN